MHHVLVRLPDDAPEAVAILRPAVHRQATRVGQELDDALDVFLPRGDVQSERAFISTTNLHTILSPPHLNKIAILSAVVTDIADLHCKSTHHISRPFVLSLRTIIH